MIKRNIIFIKKFKQMITFFNNEILLNKII